MKKFVVTRYEVHEFPVVVEAVDALDAIQRVSDGEGEQPDDASKLVGDTYVELDYTRGKAFDEFVAEHPEIEPSRVLLSKGYDTVRGMFPTVRGVSAIGGKK